MNKNEERVLIGLRTAVENMGSQEKLVDAMNYYCRDKGIETTRFRQSALSHILQTGKLPDSWIVPIEKVSGVNRKELHFLFF